jgi:hypothetical protein
MSGLAVAVPCDVLQSAAPFTPGGFERLIDWLPFFLPLGFIPLVLIILFARTRRYWVVCAFFYLGCVILTAYVLSLIFALIAIADILPVYEAGLRSMPIVGLVYAMALGIFAWFLLRMLRLRYWQPGSAPDTWEAGDEAPPAWALSPSRRDPK